MSTQYLTGIDTDSIIEQARTEDNRSNRIRKIKELLFKETGIQDTDQLYLHFDFTWRATRRTCEVLLANVRELPDESLRSQGDEWKVIFDYPFDEEGHTPQEDLERLARFRAHHPQGSRTLVWLPSFLSRQSQKDLGLLVILDYILMGDRLSSYVAHLSPADRSTARTILENQRSQLKQRLITILEGIYGIGR
ncbi:MAG TPA: phage resistance protein, partial [Acidobacteriota bacterium]|nr:phage resistance protein [Acidobacteriota bacterium]